MTEEALERGDPALNIKTEHFRIVSPPTAIVGRLMIMRGSCWLWLSKEKEGSSYELGPMSMGVPNRFENLPMSSTVLRTHTPLDDTCSGLAARLAKKHGIHCVVSGDTLDDELVLEILPKLESIIEPHFRK
jgi:hypothetical protein